MRKLCTIDMVTLLYCLAYTNEYENGMAYPYSDSFANTITSTYGHTGTLWLNNLSDLIDYCATHWQLTHLVPFSNLTYNYVLSGMQHQTPIVLKLCCDPKSLEKEVMALNAFAHHGGVAIISFNRTRGAALLERIVPGTSLVSLFPHQDDLATRIASRLLKQLHHAPIPTNTALPTLQALLPEFHDACVLPEASITKARHLKQQLLATATHTVLLHGDFHHDNILLDSDNRWHVIDPEGIIGDPVYDLGVFIRNPLKPLLAHPDPKAILTNRTRIVADILGYDTQRIYDWTYVQTTTSAYWSLQDGLTIDNHLKFLALLDEIMEI